ATGAEPRVAVAKFGEGADLLAEVGGEAAARDAVAAQATRRAAQRFRRTIRVREQDARGAGTTRARGAVAPRGEAGRILAAGGRHHRGALGVRTRRRGLPGRAHARVVVVRLGIAAHVSAALELGTAIDVAAAREPFGGGRIERATTEQHAGTKEQPRRNRCATHAQKLPSMPPHVGRNDTCRVRLARTLPVTSTGTPTATPAPSKAMPVIVSAFPAAPRRKMPARPPGSESGSCSRAGSARPSPVASAVNPRPAPRPSAMAPPTMSGRLGC